MASTASLAGPLVGSDDSVMKGVRRSRFSLHFNTARRRRWLLIQLVSVPALVADEPQGTGISRNKKEEPKSFQKLVEEFDTQRFVRRCM